MNSTPHVMLNDLKQAVNALLEKGKTGAALATLMEKLQTDSPHTTRMVVTQGKFQLAEKQLAAGVIDASDFRIQQQRIKHAIDGVVDQLKASDLAPHTDRQSGLSRAIRELPLRHLGVIDLVNCGRTDAFKRASRLLQGEERTNNSRFFFVLGPETQQPSSFAERLNYEIAQSLESENDELIDFEQYRQRLGDFTVDRLLFQTLPQGSFLSASKQLFKRHVGERLQKYNLDFDLEALTSVRQQREWPFSALTFAFQVDIDKWDDDALEYLEWLVTSFRSQTDGTGPGFYFFFVFRFPEGDWSKSSRIARSLRKLVKKEVPQEGIVLTDDQPVSTDDVAHWLRKVSPVANPRQVQEVTKHFDKLLQKQSTPYDHSDIPMSQVEFLQKMVYQQQLKA